MDRIARKDRLYTENRRSEQRVEQNCKTTSEDNNPSTYQRAIPVSSTPFRDIVSELRQITVRASAAHTSLECIGDALFGSEGRGDNCAKDCCDNNGVVDEIFEQLAYLRDMMTNIEYEVSRLERNVL